MAINASLLPVLLLLSAHSPVDAEPPKQIKLVTFNVWGHNQRLSDAAAFLQRQNAVVVLLRELPPSHRDGSIAVRRELFEVQRDLRPKGPLSQA